MNHHRRGFTLVELLVVIAIIGVLMGLLLPAVNAARERARQATCTNNQKELAVAMNSYATGGKGSYPGWIQLQKLAPTAPTTPAGYYRFTSSTKDIEISWAAKLLPKLDQKGLWDSLLQGSLNLSLDPNRPDDVPMIATFLCPSDAQIDVSAPGLTYVVNSGGPDAQISSGNPSDYKANGISHNLITSPNFQGPQVRMGADIADGAGTTLLLAENTDKDDAGNNLDGTPPYSWLRSPQAFNANTQSAEQTFGMVWVYAQDQPLAPSLSKGPYAQASFLPTKVAPSTGFAQARMAYARPSSEHPEIFIAAFCGGNVKSIANTIEYRVYQQLMTPKGSKCKWTLANNPDTLVLPPAFRNADPTMQLSNSDF